ncbi:hypothetical protein K439DRAFT_1639000 [Ramaria rubella]|nr:hypothetical protein K439DRAFT_1640866 [Ramaria rubella]KAF8578263.1 hypothetical protein K439DRAFT_1639000 [Ramaria rubella]
MHPDGGLPVLKCSNHFSLSSSLDPLNNSSPCTNSNLHNRTSLQFRRRVRGIHSLIIGDLVHARNEGVYFARSASDPLTLIVC